MNDDVKRILTKIHQASEQGSLSFFVGAGVSMLSGQPSWEELLNNIKSICDEVLKEHLVQKKEPIENIIDLVLKKERNKENDEAIKKSLSTNNEEITNYSSKDNYAVAQILYDALELGSSKEKFNDIVKSCFNENAVDNEIHENIISLSPSSIITTNFDDLIEKACKSKAEKFVTVASDDDVSSIQGQRFILKIHGDFDHKNIVFTEDSYLDYERNFPLISRMLTSILATNTVVFMGYSLSDFNIRLLVNLLKPLYKKIESDKKILQKRLTISSSLNLNNDTRPIFYNIGSKKLSKEERKYLLNKGIEPLDCRDLDVRVAQNNYKEQYALLFSQVNSLYNKFTSTDEDNTHDLYESFVRYESFNAVTTDMLMDVSSKYISGIYKLNDTVFSLCLNKCSNYGKYLFSKETISEQIRKECDFITTIFLKAGIRKILVSYSSKIIDLYDLVDYKKVIKREQFYNDCISFDYKKIEAYSKRLNIDYRLKNYALYKLEKYDDLLNSIEFNSKLLYLKANRDIEFIFSKLNYDNIKKIVDKRNDNSSSNLKNKTKEQENGNYSKKECISSDATIVENCSEDKKNINKIDNDDTLGVNLDRIIFSRLLNNVSIPFKQNYSFLLDSTFFPIPKGNIRTIKFCYQHITRDIFTGDSIISTDVNKLIQSLVETQRYLMLNGILKDEGDYLKNFVIDSIISILPTMGLKEGQSFGSSNKTTTVEFNNEVFYLMIEYCSSIWLSDCFKYRKISKLYSGFNNKGIFSIELSINNLLNYAKKHMKENKFFYIENSEIWYLSPITYRIANLVVISTYLNLSFGTSYKVAEFVFDNFLALFTADSDGMVSFFSSILNESHKDDQKLKQLLTKWLKKTLAEFMNDSQSFIKYSKSYRYLDFINLLFTFLHKYSNLNWLDSIYLKFFRQGHTQLYNFASLRLSYFVSNNAISESLKIAHSALELKDHFDINLVFFIIKSKDNLTNSELEKLKRHLNILIEQVKSSATNSFQDPLSSVFPIAYYSTFGNLPRVFNEFLGYSQRFDFLYLYKDFDFSKFKCDWLLYESDTALDNYFSDCSVKHELLKALSIKLKDPNLSRNDKSKYMDIFLKYSVGD